MPRFSPGRFIFRCDGNAAVGLGHVSRCIALAEVLQELGIGAAFAGAYGTAAQALLTSAGFQFIEMSPLTENDLARETLRVVSESAAVNVVFDSYSAGAAHIDEVGTRIPGGVVVIDDFARLPSCNCAAVLNFTVNAPRLIYREGPWLLLGPSYLLVRRRLRRLRARKRRSQGRVQRVLISIGGTDRHQLASRVLDALLAVRLDIHARVAAGSSDLEKRLKRLGSESGLVPGGADLADEFALADVCISGGGLSKYESAYLGIPSAVLSQTPEQAGETEDFVRHRLAVDLGLGPEISQSCLEERLGAFLANVEQRAAIAAAGREVFPDDPTMRAAKAIVGVPINIGTGL